MPSEGVNISAMSSHALQVVMSHPWEDWSELNWNLELPATKARSWLDDKEVAEYLSP